jgi:hypothetical protein
MEKFPEDNLKSKPEIQGLHLRRELYFNPGFHKT